MELEAPKENLVAQMLRQGAANTGDTDPTITAVTSAGPPGILHGRLLNVSRMATYKVRWPPESRMS